MLSMVRIKPSLNTLTTHVPPYPKYLQNMQFSSPVTPFLKSPEFVCFSTVDAISSSLISLCWHVISSGWLLMPSGLLGFIP